MEPWNGRLPANRFGGPSRFQGSKVPKVGGATPDNIVNVDFRRHFHIQPGERVLDLGCGSGRHTVEACRWPCNVVGADLSRQDLRVARYMLADLQRRKIAPGHADFVIADAQHLPFRDGAFDKVVCTEVLEHIPDDRAGVRELVRVLRPGGDIAVSVPSHGPEVVFWAISWEYWHTPGGHVRMYQPGEMWRTLEEHGLRLHLQRRRHSFQTFYWFVRCAFGKDNDFFPLTRFLTRFINWYHNRRRVRLLENIEAVLDLVLGKDTILYGTKPPSEESTPLTNGRLSGQLMGDSPPPPEGGGMDSSPDAPAFTLGSGPNVATESPPSETT